MPKLIAWALAALAAFALLVAVNLGRRTAGLSLAPEAPGARLERLAPHWRILRPEGAVAGGAILLSGCDGVRDNMQFWAEALVRRGRVALILDSHTPRGLDRLDLWRLVCAGQLMGGGERAGDLAVALQALGESEGVTEDVVVLGASHGGWTAMEFASRAGMAEAPPTGLTRWPAPPRALLGRVSGLLLLYPYCGILNRAVGGTWRAAPPTLMILAGEDSIVDTGDCLTRARDLRADGARVETGIVPGADHGFDQRQKALFSTLEFDAGQRDAALGHVLAFLATLD